MSEVGSSNPAGAAGVNLSSWPRLPDPKPTHSRRPSAPARTCSWPPWVSFIPFVVHGSRDPAGGRPVPGQAAQGWPRRALASTTAPLMPPSAPLILAQPPLYTNCVKPSRKLASISAE